LTTNEQGWVPALAATVCQADGWQTTSWADAWPKPGEWAAWPWFLWHSRSAVVKSQAYSNFEQQKLVSIIRGHAASKSYIGNCDIFCKKCLCIVGLRLLHYFPAEAPPVFEPKRTTNLRPN